MTVHSAAPDAADGVRRTTGAADPLTRAVDRLARPRRGLPAPQILVRTPDREASGGDRDRRFHTASVGKMMTATLALQLHERGALDLAAPVTDLLPAPEWLGLFTDPGAVTAWHLLTHTSGAADYFEGRTTRGPRFLDVLRADPDRRWHPEDLLDFTRDHQEPLAVPGARFAYSDTGYVLLGRIVEQVGGASLGRQLHERIFTPVGMTASSLAFHTLPGGADAAGSRPADIAPLRVGRTELSRAAALSCDWAGGGVVSTLDDLLRFSDAWHDGALLTADSRARMQRITARFRPGIHYGAGLMELRYRGFTPFVSLPRTHGHLGVTGVHLFAAPEQGICLALNFHATREMVRSFRAHITLLQAALRG